MANKGKESQAEDDLLPRLWKTLRSLDTAQRGTWNDWRVGTTRSGRYTVDMGLRNPLDRMIEEDDVILDLGCSHGYTTYDLSEMYSNAHVLGIDASERVKDSKKIRPNDSPDHLSSLQGVSPGLPFSAEIDAIIACNSIHKVAHQIRKDATEGEKDLQREYIKETLQDLSEASRQDGSLLMADARTLSYIRLDRSREGEEKPWYTTEIRGYSYRPTSSEITMPEHLFAWTEMDCVQYDDRVTVYEWDGGKEVQREEAPIRVL